MLRAKKDNTTVAPKSRQDGKLETPFASPMFVICTRSSPSSTKRRTAPIRLSIPPYTSYDGPPPPVQFASVYACLPRLSMSRQQLVRFTLPVSQAYSFEPVQKRWLHLPKALIHEHSIPFLPPKYLIQVDPCKTWSRNHSCLRTPSFRTTKQSCTHIALARYLPYAIHV